MLPPRASGLIAEVVAKVEGVLPGVAVDVGSALQLTEDTTKFGKLDELRIINNAEREALGFEGKASIFLTKEDASRTAGKNARTAGQIGAATSLLGAGSALSGLGGGTAATTSNFGTAGGGPGQFGSSGL